MELKTYFAQDRNGNLIPSANVSIYLTGTTTLASGLTNVSGSPIANPFTADADGKIQFRAPDGIYDMQVALGSTTGVKVTFQCVDVEQQLADANTAASRAETAADNAEAAALSIEGQTEIITANAREHWRRTLAEAGINLVSGSFEDGATANTSLDAVWHKEGGQCYTWGGTLPKIVLEDSTPYSTGGIGDGAWSSVSVKNITADNVDTSSGLSVQEELDKHTDSTFASFASAIGASIKSENARVTYKYGTVNYIASGTTGAPSTGNALKFYDATGKGYQINEPRRTKNDAGIIAFSEVWTAINLDPTLFIKASEFGINTFVFYTWTAPLQTYLDFLDLAALYGFNVIIQAVPNSQYSSDIDADFAKLSPLFSHKAVVGLYLFDEPNLATYPLTRQGEIIAKAKTLSSLPLYAASNAEANFETVPLHMDIDFVFTSQYAHFIGANGIRRYAATMWSSMEEEGLRQGRIIPLLTAYWYENEAPVLNTSQIKSVNDFIVKNFDHVGAWAFYADKAGHFVENDQQIYDLVKSSLALRKTPVKRTKLIRTFFRSANALPANSYKYLTKPALASDIYWLNPPSIATWNAAAGVLRIKNGEQFAINFGRPVRLEAIVASFTDNNGLSNSATLALVFNPTIDNGRQYGTTVNLTGGGDAEWFFSSPGVPAHLINMVAVKVIASNGTDYLILERLGFVVSE